MILRDFYNELIAYEFSLEDGIVGIPIESARACGAEHEHGFGIWHRNNGRATFIAAYSRSTISYHGGPVGPDWDQDMQIFAGGQDFDMCEESRSVELLDLALIRRFRLIDSGRAQFSIWYWPNPVREFTRADAMNPFDGDFFRFLLWRYLKLARVGK